MTSTLHILHENIYLLILQHQIFYFQILFPLLPPTQWFIWLKLFLTYPTLPTISNTRRYVFRLLDCFYELVALSIFVFQAFSGKFQRMPPSRRGESRQLVCRLGFRFIFRLYTRITIFTVLIECSSIISMFARMEW